MGAAVQPMSNSANDLHGLWFSRVARTVSHEIGHCFCLGHCSYYACVMQGTTSVAEDVRQPPYLCPVCLAKITHAMMGVSPETGDNEQAYIVQRYQALMEFCQSWLHVGGEGSRFSPQGVVPLRPFVLIDERALIGARET
ncbi:hypothetical protein B0H65DRAFT_445214 [Neurospora tetraspora]|uniref:Uncharacterized protein n=1 Tax=Neurospora tetraspora TaxID=94610 RepID=A0AAE0J947_9PEZI|nr:hypothetical protein B0H65DRAFT_445214 [Neurospora tetraspora]